MLDYSHCTLCPRRCGVNRLAGERGFCGMPAELRAARAAAHYWEEPVISGDFGSGAVFFSGCTLRCSFCQNEKISLFGYGAALTPNRLRDIFMCLIDEGVSNINLVTATQFLPSILPALQPKLPVPVVLNSGGYESVETLRALEGVIDVYLPDFKYSDRALAKQLSHAEDYPEIAAAAIREMVRQVGSPVIADGVLQRGVLVRHLVLPGCIDNSLGVLDWLDQSFPGRNVLFSLMRQYVPMGTAAKTPPFDRRVSDLEYDAVLSYAELLGLENGYVQEAGADDARFIPPFNLEGL